MAVQDFKNVIQNSQGNNESCKNTLKHCNF